MRFENPSAVFLFLGVLGLLIFYFLTRRQGQKALESFAQKELLVELLSSLDRKRQRMRMLFLFSALFFSIVALMRPQWGFYWEEGRQRGLDILIAIDTSRSMLAEDVKPNRMEQAKAIALGFARQLKGDRIGLVAFSGQAFRVCPLTSDTNGFRLAIDNLGVDTIPQGGTSLSSAIREALKDYREKEKIPRILILLSDGEDHEGEALQWAEKAKQVGLGIFCLGLGTNEGGLIPILQEGGQREFLKDQQGRVVKSVRNEDFLEKIASRSTGSYIRADEGESGLKRIYDERLSQIEKGGFVSQRRKQFKEWFQIPLALAWLLLVIEPFIPGRKKER